MVAPVAPVEISISYQDKSIALQTSNIDSSTFLALIQEALPPYNLLRVMCLTERVVLKAAPRALTAQHLANIFRALGSLAEAKNSQTASQEKIDEKDWLERELREKIKDNLTAAELAFSAAQRETGIQVFIP
jgi:hypothetical protein